MTDKIVNREDLPKDYTEMMKTESHHNHSIIVKNGVYRWEENSYINSLVDDIGLNELIMLLQLLDYNKNSEIYRKLYRCMGYSLSGYWDVFYWDVNNDLESEYKPNGKYS